jgi:hypothetical protein
MIITNYNYRGDAITRAAISFGNMCAVLRELAGKKLNYEARWQNAQNYHNIL